MANRPNRGGNVPAPMEDNTSPYYLHPSDSPGLQLVSQVLIGSNYMNWSRSVVTALLAKNKLPFVTGALLRPDEDHLLFPAWIRCNSMVVSWLRNSISPQICSSVMYLDDAHDIWTDLRDRFSQSDSARSYQLRQQIMSLTLGQSDVNAYFTNQRIVWDEFKHSQPISWCSCNNCRCNSAAKWHSYQEQECTMQFLIGLNSSFSQVRSHILSMVPLPSLSKVFSLVVQEEKHRNIDGLHSGLHSSIPHSSSEQLFAANAASSSYNRGRLCTHCGKTNHTIDRCFTLHGFSQGFGRGRGKPGPRDFVQPKSVNYVDDRFADPVDKGVANPVGVLPSVDQCQQLIALLQSQLAVTSPSQISSPDTSSAALISSPSSSSQHNTSAPQQPLFTGTTLFSSFIATISSSTPHWLLDTGATHHVCCNLSLFSSSSPVDNAFVNLPNGGTAMVTHMGTIHLTPTITLYSVLCVPSFSFNLISVSSLTSSLSCTVIFTHDSLEIQEASQGTLIGKGSRIGNLYTLDVESGISVDSPNSPNCSSSFFCQFCCFC